MRQNIRKRKIISAGDLESYAYCPLSFFLKKMGYSQEQEYIKNGISTHKRITRNINKIRKIEKRAHLFESYILPFSIGSSIIALIAIIFHPTWNVEIWREIFIILSLIWLFYAIFILYKTERGTNKNLRPKYETVILISAIFSTVIALFSLSDFLPSFPVLSKVLSLLSLFWLIWANIFFYISSIYLEESLLKRKKYKVEKSLIEYVDYGKSDDVLVSKEHGLSGKPDYITIDKYNQHIPIEIKTGRKPRYPYFSHIIQIGVYALLVDQLYGHCPGGVIRYDEKAFFVKLNEKLRRTVKEIRCKIIRDLQKESMHRNHGRKGKCKNCSMRENCPERLC